jgi:hypothetical protein
MPPQLHLQLRRRDLVSSHQARTCVLRVLPAHDHDRLPRPNASCSLFSTIRLLAPCNLCTRAGGRPQCRQPPERRKCGLTAMLPTSQRAESHSLAASTARAAMAPHDNTTALQSRRLSLSLILTCRTPTDAHTWPRNAHAPLSGNPAACLRNPRRLTAPTGPPPVCRCGHARSAASQVPSSHWPACEGRPSLRAA